MLRSGAGIGDFGLNRGFLIDRTIVSSEELALHMLSRDNSFDFYYVSSGDTVAVNIRDKGSFYPLNNIPYVQEYIDACFPFIQDVAKDVNGNIWMLPYFVDIEALIFDEKKSIDLEIDIDSIKTPTDIVNA